MKKRIIILSIGLFFSFALAGIAIYLCFYNLGWIMYENGITPGQIAKDFIYATIINGVFGILFLALFFFLLILLIKQTKKGKRESILES